MLILAVVAIAIINHNNNDNLKNGKKEKPISPDSSFYSHMYHKDCGAKKAMIYHISL